MATRKKTATKTATKKRAPRKRATKKANGAPKEIKLTRAQKAELEALQLKIGDRERVVADPIAQEYQAKFEERRAAAFRNDQKLKSLYAARQAIVDEIKAYVEAKAPGYTLTRIDIDDDTNVGTAIAVPPQS
jgi:hypothetical protein